MDEGAETGPSAAADGGVDDESLDVLGVVHELPQSIVYLIEDLLADGVVATGKVVGRILLAVQQELRVVHLRARAGADIIDNSRLQVNSDLARHELSGAGLLEESGEVRVFHLILLFHDTVVLNLVLGGVLLPHGVPELNSSLADADGNNFTSRHCVFVLKRQASVYDKQALLNS